MKLKKEKIESRIYGTKNKTKLKELEKLNALKLEIENELEVKRKELKKHKNIRNLKIFKSTCQLLAPLAISTGIVVGGIKLIGGGLPFFLDNEKRYKAYELNMQTNDSFFCDETYVKKEWYSDSIVSNIKVYTPWENTDKGYKRIRRIYEFKNLTDADIYNAVKNEDYDYIFNNITDYIEEEQYIKEINKNDINSYWLSANITLLDKTEYIDVKESNDKNLTCTILDSALCFTLIIIIEYLRDYKYLPDIKDINSKYSFKYDFYKKIINDKNTELNDVKNKIFTLTKGDKNVK